MRRVFKYSCHLLLCLFHITCDRAGTVEPRDTYHFIKYFGSSGDQFGKKVIALDDGFVIVGTSRKTRKDSDIFVVRTDLRGNQLWSKILGSRGNNDDTGIAITKFAKGFIVVGNSKNSGGNTDILVYNISISGEKIASTVIGDPRFNDEIADVMITQVGNIMMAGASGNTSVRPGGAGGVYDFYFPQLLPDLTPVPGWIGRYGFSGKDKAVAVAQKANGDFVFLGTTDKQEQNGSGKKPDNMILFQITQQGLPNTNDITFGTLGKEMANSISSTSDGGFILVGSTSSTQGNSKAFLSVVRQNNSLLGSYKIKTTTNVTGRYAREAQGGGYVVLGDIMTPTGTDIYMSRTTNEGDILWEKTFGASGKNTAGAILQLKDGSYIFTGSVNLDNQSKMCLIKTNKNGDLNPL